MRPERTLLFFAIEISDSEQEDLDHEFKVVAFSRLNQLEVTSNVSEIAAMTVGVSSLIRNKTEGGHVDAEGWCFYDWHHEKLPLNILVQEVPPPGIVFAVRNRVNILTPPFTFDLLNSSVIEQVKASFTGNSMELNKFLVSKDAHFQSVPLTGRAQRRQPQLVVVPDTEEKLTVFICYASEDYARTKELFDRLVGAGVDAWIDRERLVAGQVWKPEIRKAIRSSDAIIVCLSKHSVTKDGFVNDEIREALEGAREKPFDAIHIIPTRFESVEVPSPMQHWQWVDLFETDGYQKLLTALQLRAKQIGQQRKQQ